MTHNNVIKAMKVQRYNIKSPKNTLNDLQTYFEIHILGMTPILAKFFFLDYREKNQNSNVSQTICQCRKKLHQYASIIIGNFNPDIGPLLNKIFLAASERLHVVRRLFSIELNL